MKRERPRDVTVAKVERPSDRTSGLWTFEPTRGWWIEGSANARILDHDAFVRNYPAAEVVAISVRDAEPSQSLVATLRTPIPVGGLGALAGALSDLYGQELVILPFSSGEFARVVRR